MKIAPKKLKIKGNASRQDAKAQRKSKTDIGRAIARKTILSGVFSDFKVFPAKPEKLMVFFAPWRLGARIRFCLSY